MRGRWRAALPSSRYSSIAATLCVLSSWSTSLILPMGELMMRPEPELVMQFAEAFDPASLSFMTLDACHVHEPDGVVGHPERPSMVTALRRCPFAKAALGLTCGALTRVSSQGDEKGRETRGEVGDGRRPRLRLHEYPSSQILRAPGPGVLGGISVNQGREGKTPAAVARVARAGLLRVLRALGLPSQRHQDAVANGGMVIEECLDQG